MASGRKGGGLFSLQGEERGVDVGIGADPAARSRNADLIFGRTLTEADIGKGVEIPEPVYATSDAYTPYGAAWKEYDRLQKTAKSSGVLSMGHGLIGALPGLMSLFDPRKHDRPYEAALFVLVIVLAAVQAVRARWAASRLAHWPCPRCHSEWPGKKLQKDPQCNVCGLKLHQLMP
jgi:hypothetical protein